MDRCTLDPDCGYGQHAAEAHPCGQPIHVGDPCRFCADPIQGVDGVAQPCPRCWMLIPDNLADAKALLALADLSVEP